MPTITEADSAGNGSSGRGQPVEQVLEHARVAVVVFGGEDPHAVGLNHGLAGGGYGCRRGLVGSEMCIRDRYYAGIDLGMSLGPIVGGLLYGNAPIQWFYPLSMLTMPAAWLLYAATANYVHGRTR